LKSGRLGVGESRWRCGNALQKAAVKKSAIRSGQISEKGATEGDVAIQGD
jgi:hypothetical protein